MKNLNRQSGAAIIVALFVVALVAAAAIAMISRLNIDTRRTELLINTTQANFYAQGSIDWAMDQLINNVKNQQTDKVTDKTPIKSPIKKVNGAIISSTIYDAQDKFNLNTLKDQQNQATFLNLMHIIAPKLEPLVIHEITLNILHWITPGLSNNTLDTYYAKQTPSSAAAHHPMASISELRLVKSITPDLFNALSPYVSALPSDVNVINVNSAPAEVLMSLSNGMSIEAAKAIVQYRQQNPFGTVQNFLNFDIVKNNPIPQKAITVTSNYFLVETDVIIGDQQLTLYTLLNRSTKDPTKDSKPTVTVVWQSKGTL